MVEKSLSHGRSGNGKKATTIEKRQNAKKKLLLEKFEEAPNIGQALAHVGINRSTYSRWRHSDDTFAKDADEAIKCGIEKTADMVETSLISNARDGNVQAQKYYLEHNHPRYKIRYRWEVGENDGHLSVERQSQISRALLNWTNYFRGKNDPHFRKP